MPADVELSRREGVELVRTGRYQTLTGSWNPTPADIKAAVEAMDCPAIRKPVIRIGHTDKRFQISGDGEPALGWFENLRATDDGHTLVADQVTLPWLHSVQAAAYPSRSIEGNYRHRCSEGHTHPFVIHTVALLGVTPPGVQTLRSLNDLPEMLGVAASGEVPEGAEHVQVTVMAAGEAHTGAMIALMPTAEDVERLAVDGGEPADQLHLTLAFLGEAADLGARGKQDVIDHVSTVANGLPRLEAEVFSVNVFNPGGADGRDTCLVWGVTGDIIDAVHELVAETLHLIDAPIPSQHSPWAAHITGAYTDDLGRIAELAAKVGPISFDRLRLAFGGEFIDIPLMEWPGEKSDTLDNEEAVAAAEAGNDNLHRFWTKGAGLKRWASKPHPWTALFNQLKNHMSADKAKRTASKWHLEVLGRTPNQKGVKASGQPLAPTGLPAAEPEHEITSEPNEEDIVSTELSGLRSRLGLPDDADLTAIEAKVDEMKADAEKTPEPDPALIQASAAAAEKATKAEEAQALMREELTKVRSELDTIKASAAQTIKASAFDGWLATGRLKPADKQVWEARYDRDPEMVTDILGGRAEYSEVPVMASGVTGPAEPEGGADPFDADYERHFSNTEKAGA